MLSPQILFEDAHLIVLSKPAGLLSQGEKTGDANLVDWLRSYLGRSYVGLVHRLDRNTSGVMVVAKRTKSAQRLTQALQSGRIKRSYLAWVEGTLAQETVWRHFLVKDSKSNQVRVVREQDSIMSKNREAKEALLSVRPIQYGEWNAVSLTLAEFTLQTGRSHQIRAQSAKEGYPVVGDVKYGSGRTRNFGRPALHSIKIEFPHPISGEELKFEDPLPVEMRTIRILR